MHCEMYPRMECRLEYADGCAIVLVPWCVPMCVPICMPGCTNVCVVNLKKNRNTTCVTESNFEMHFYLSGAE